MAYTAKDGRVFNTAEERDAHDRATGAVFNFMGGGSTVAAPSQAQTQSANQATERTQSVQDFNREKAQSTARENADYFMFQENPEVRAERLAADRDRLAEWRQRQEDKLLPQTMGEFGQLLGSAAGFAAGGPLGGIAGGLAAGAIGGSADRAAANPGENNSYAANQARANAADRPTVSRPRPVQVGADSGATAAGRAGLTADQAVAQSDIVDRVDQAAAQRSPEFEQNLERLKGIDTSLESPAARQARELQLEGAQMQRQLFEELQAFDPTKFATNSANEATARALALARSGAGGVGARQLAEESATDRFGEFFNQGQQQAAGIESQRLSQAANVAANFGQLATGTRSQDESKAANSAQLGLSVANSINDSLGTQFALDQNDTKLLGDLAYRFQSLGVDLAKMDSQEAVALLQAAVGYAGQDTQMAIARMQSQAAKEGKESDFWNSLASGLIGGGATLGAAYIAS